MKTHAVLFRLSEMNIARFDFNDEYTRLWLLNYKNGVLWEYDGKVTIDLQSELFGTCFTIHDELIKLWPYKKGAIYYHDLFTKNKEKFKKELEKLTSMRYT